MALGSTVRPLFSQRWVDALAPAAGASMIATIVITDPNASTSTYNATTDTWTLHTVTVYTGKARVQPKSIARLKNVPGDTTYLKRVLFSIPIANKSLDLREALQVRVTVSPLNPALMTYLFIIDEVVDSSNPFERTFYGSVDVETVV